MIIEGTELECNEAECVALDYFLGGSGEDREAWAKRVWDCCAEYKETDGKGRDGKGMPSVYAQDPHFLWEQKKRKRRLALVSELKGKKQDKHLAETKKVKDDLKNKEKAKWSFDLADPQILELKKHARYKTRTEREAEMEAEQVAEEKKFKDDLSDKVNVLRGKGFDDDTIKIIFPKAASVI